jgi:hypothetical protein
LRFWTGTQDLGAPVLGQLPQFPIRFDLLLSILEHSLVRFLLVDRGLRGEQIVLAHRASQVGRASQSALGGGRRVLGLALGSQNANGRNGQNGLQKLGSHGNHLVEWGFFGSAACFRAAAFRPSMMEINVSVGYPPKFAVPAAEAYNRVDLKG